MLLKAMLAKIVAEEEKDLVVEVADLVDEAKVLIEAVITTVMATEESLHRMVALFQVNALS